MTGPAVSSGAGGSAAAGEPPGAGDDADDDVVEVPGPGAAPGSGSAAGGSTNGADRDPQGQQQQQQQRRKGVARIIDARLSHQRGEIQHPQGPRAGAGNGGSAGPSAPPAAPPAAPGAGPATTAAAAATPAALRAAREDAELAHRQLSQLQGLPTSIEGFKAHPLYVLKRHIGKYEVRRLRHLAVRCPTDIQRMAPLLPQALKYALWLCGVGRSRSHALSSSRLFCIPYWGTRHTHHRPARRPCAPAPRRWGCTAASPTTPDSTSACCTPWRGGAGRAGRWAGPECRVLRPAKGKGLRRGEARLGCPLRVLLHWYGSRGRRARVPGLPAIQHLRPAPHDCPTRPPARLTPCTHAGARRRAGLPRQGG